MKRQSRLSAADANKELATAIRLLGVLVKHEGTHCHSVCSSWMHNALNDAEGLIKRNAR